jgi:hypothetical protein
MRKLIALSFLLVAAACSSKEEYPEERVWIGRTKQDLIQKWGLPQKKESDGSNGEIYIYDVADAKKKPKNPGKQEYHHLRKFYIDSTNKVYRHENDQNI